MKLNYSPWGVPDYQKQVADGIISVGTPSHGGYYVRPDVYEQMPAALRCNVYGGGTWFEEDCEVALVMLAFPQYYTEWQLYCAWLTFAREDEPNKTYYRAHRWLIETAEGQKLIGRFAAFLMANALKYQTGGMSSGGKGWDVSASRLDGLETVRFWMPEYPSFGGPFTLAEAEAKGARLVEKKATALPKGVSA